MSLIEWLILSDKQCFRFIQTHLTAPWLDPAMVLIRNPFTWIPVYAFMLYWILRNDRKLAIRFILFTLILVGLTDYTAAEWWKPLFGRWRPCYDPGVQGLLRGLVNCGGLFSFPSNHATNHFCMAAFWFATTRYLRGKQWYWNLLWIWAVLVSYAQVYVGKHFPLDVFCGALYGTGIGLGGAWVFRNWALLPEKVSRFFRKRAPVTEKVAREEYTPA